MDSLPKGHALRTQHARGPSVLAGRPCGFSCKARCKWSYFRQLARYRGSAARQLIDCAQAARGSRVARRATVSPNKPLLPRGRLDLKSRTGLTVPRVAGSDATLRRLDFERLQTLSWWLNVCVVGITALACGNEVLKDTGVSEWLHQPGQSLLGSLWNFYSGCVDSSPILAKVGAPSSPRCLLQVHELR